METHRGILPNKRLRFWWAVVGLIALVVPYVTNMGLLAKTVYAAEKTLYKSDRLTVTAGDGNDWKWENGREVSWKFQFIDKDANYPNKDEVTFLIDKEAAAKQGLTDFKVNGQSWDAKTGELGGFELYYNGGSGHSLILTAKSTTDEKRAVSVPVGLALTRTAQQGAKIKAPKLAETNLLPDDAKMMVEANLFGYEGDAATGEDEGETKPDEPETTLPAPGSDDPADVYAKLPDTKQGIVDGFLIERGVRTTPDSDNKTDFNNFQLWSSMNAPVYTTADADHKAPVTIYQKKDVTATGNIGGSENENDATRLQYVRSTYHNQYEQTGGDNQSAYTISFEDGDAMTNAKFTVVYDHVGSYVDSVTKEHHPIGATMTISNVTPASGDHLQLGNMHFIDVPNNLYSGVMYHGIESLDIKLQFYTLVDGKFAERIDVDEGDGHVTFSSLNNFGRSANSSSSVGADFSWDQLSTGINNSKYAETVFGGAGTLAAQPYDDPTTDSDDTFMQKDAAGIWYSTVHGVYDLTDVNGTSYKSYLDIEGYESNFEDSLGGTNFQMAALQFPVSGDAYNFTLRTGDGNTWQTISAAVMHPLELTQTHKLVTTDDTTYTTAVSDAKAGKSGNMHEKNLAITSTDDGKFNVAYWVTQPTYDLGTDSLIRPFGIRFEDTLPDGISLRDGQNSVKLYDTEGKQLKLGADYTVTIAGQKVVATLTDAGIQAIDFNSDMFALRLDVKTDSQVAQGFAEWTKHNTADVYTKTEHSDASEYKSTTNTVTVKLHPLSTTNVTINKVDEAGAALAGAKFELKKVGEPSAWTAASFASAEISAYKTLTTATTIAASSTTETSWTWNNLPVGQYQLIETAPDGYVKATDVTFNVGAKLTANADGTGDAYTSTFKETTNPAVLTNVDVKDGSVTANVPNQLDIKAVFQVKKVDQDNKPLAGAVFQYFTDVTQKTGMNKDDTTGMHTMPTGQTLEFNKLYTLNESTVPTGYERAEDVYFKVLKQADFTTQTGVTVPAALANEKVLFVKTDKDGAVTEWIKPDQNKNIFTKTFTVENKKQEPLQSIFPVTGGTGIMGFVIVGLILVGAAGALTLKRKFND